MTDFETIRRHLEKLVGGIDDADLASLFRVLGKAQNGPPDGTADGTVNAREWEAFAKAADALSRAKALARGVLGS